MHHLALQNSDWQSDEVEHQLTPGTLGRVRAGVAIVNKCKDVEIRLCIFANGQEPLQEPDECPQVMT